MITLRAWLAPQPQHCRPNIDVDISDWRQADEVIRRLGAIIRADELGLLFSVGLAALDIPE